MSKRALVIGVADRRPGNGLSPGPTIQAITSLLAELGGWLLEVLEGLDASRERMLAALHDLAGRVQPGDSVLVHFFGHGGVVRFTDALGELGARPIFYLSAARRGTETEMTGVLDVELSAVLRRIDARCQNLTVILDCCHSAQIVRGRIREVAAPSWVQRLPVRPDDEGLFGNHSSIVRLAGTSSLHFGFAQPTTEGHLGLLTEGFTAVVREAGLAIDRVTWDTVAHRVREYAIQIRGYEEQWVTLAGPRNRLLFSRETIELPRSVGFVSGQKPGRGWLRAGLLQGVSVGDEWGITALVLDADRQPQLLARARVVATDLNRARVELIQTMGEHARLPDGSSALLLRARDRSPVRLEGDAEDLRRALDTSPVLRPAQADEAAFAATSVPELAVPSIIHVRRETDGLTPFSFSDQGQALTLLEDWGRSQLLLRALDTNTSALHRPPVHVAWGRCDEDRDVHLPLCGGRLSEGERVYFELAHLGLTPESWYVCVIEIDVAGRPILLSTSEPDGLEIELNQTVFLGRRHALQRSGVELRWPDFVPRDHPREVMVLLLMSLRPMELGHLVRTPGPEDRNLWSGGPSERGAHAPVLSTKWAWTKIRYTLAPRGSD